MRLVSQAGAGMGSSVRCFFFKRIGVRMVLSNIGTWRLFVNVGHGGECSAPILSEGFGCLRTPRRQLNRVPV